MNPFRQYCTPLRVLWGFLFLIVFFPPLRAQSPDAATKLRVAQTFEQAGEWERATGLYEELNQADPTNYVYYDGLRRGYEHLKLYDKAVALVLGRLKFQPADPGLLSSLGGLYLESGNDPKADSVWQSIIAVDPKNATLYLVVASSLMEHRMFEQAMRIYEQGRRAIRNEALFAEELASLHSALQQYGDATKEYLRILQTAPQNISYVESRIGSFTLRAEGLKEASAAVRDALLSSPGNSAFHSLQAWLDMEGKDYDGAFREYATIEKLNNSTGFEMFNFGQRALQEHASTIAAAAYKFVLDEKSNPGLAPQARFGYARATEESDRSGETPASAAGTGMQTDTSVVRESPAGAQRAIELYSAVIRDFPTTEYAVQLYFRIGVLKFERMSDFNGALENFRNVQSLRQGQPVSYDAALKAGEVLTAANDLKGARREYLPMQTVPLNAYRLQAQFKLAELDYFEARFDSALSGLHRVSTNLTSDLTNDALELEYFIQENKTSSPAALALFSHGDLLVRQKRFSEALPVFDDVVRRYPTSLLVDDATMRIAELHLDLHQTVQALEAFTMVADSLAASILKDRAQMRIAEVYQTVLRDNVHALAAYEQLLTRYPNSLYAEEARKRIRTLRGDSL